MKKLEVGQRIRVVEVLKEEKYYFNKPIVGSFRAVTDEYSGFVCRGVDIVDVNGSEPYMHTDEVRHVMTAIVKSVKS